MTITNDDDLILGHNSADIKLQVQVKMYNSVSRFAGKEGICRKLDFPAGSDIADVLKRLNIPHDEVFLIFVNGRDVTPELGTIRTTYALEDQDVIALSGPVPYSWGYGAPIV